MRCAIGQAVAAGTACHHRCVLNPAGKGTADGQRRQPWGLVLCLICLSALCGAAGGRNGVFSHQAVLALAGLVSAAVSSYKNWNS